MQGPAYHFLHLRDLPICYSSQRPELNFLIKLHFELSQDSQQTEDLEGVYVELRTVTIT